MRRYALRDDQWDRIRDILPGREGHVGGTAADNRLFVEAVLFRFRAGIPWRDLPERFGDWKIVYQRFNRWAKSGVFEWVFRLLASAAAFYVGHGLASGWAGYGGFGVASAAEAAGDPLGAVISISCSAAARPRKGFSFCEELALTGLCAGALGAVSRTLHGLNVALALSLASALAEDPCPTLASLMLACPWPQNLAARYRIIGDPLAPLVAAPAAAAAAGPSSHRDRTTYCLSSR
jgi:transposase